MFVWSCLVVVAAHLPNQSAHNCSRIQFSTECPSKLFTSSVYIYEYSHQISVGDIALCTNDPYTPPAEHPSETRVNAAFSTRSVVGLPWLVGWLVDVVRSMNQHNLSCTVPVAWVNTCTAFIKGITSYHRT